MDLYPIVESVLIIISIISFYVALDKFDILGSEEEVFMEIGTIIAIVLAIVSAVLSYVLAPSNDSTSNPSTIEDFDIPTVEDGKQMPVIFGTVTIDSANILWYGDLDYTTIEDHDVVIGYNYFMGMHIQVCLGLVDELIEIIAGERTAWDSTVDGPVTSNQQIYIDKGNLFGGDRKEGGVQGYVDVEFGDVTQTQNDYLLEQLTGGEEDIPAFRGAFGLVLRKLYLCSSSPYVKPWSITLRRQPAPGWYDSKYNINSGSANPAHIIYECLTSEIWGLGYDSSLIDDVSFQAAADTLYTENFGLSLKLVKPSEVEAFILNICSHIQGVVGYNHNENQIFLKLIRDDYDSETIPSFRTDDGTLLGVDEFYRPSPGEIVNQVNLKYKLKGDTDYTTITGQNLASIQSQGAVIQNDITYDGIDSDQLASEVLARDLQIYASSLAGISARLNRTAWDLLKGDVCRLIWEDPNLGSIDIIIRITDIDYGTLDNGAIIIKGTQDIFGTTEYSVISPSGSLWANPITEPEALTYHGMMELTYWDMLNLLPDRTLTSSNGFIQYYGIAPSSTYLGFDFYTKLFGGTYAYSSIGSLSPSIFISEDIGHTDTVLPITSSSLGSVGTPTIGSYCMIDDEIMRVDAIDSVNHTITVGRGCIDTVCSTHSTASPIFCVESFRAFSNTTYYQAQIVVGEGRTRTSIGLLSTDDAPDDTLNIVARQNKPYPPGSFRVNSVAYPDSIVGELTISWTHRDRTQQISTLISEDYTDIGPESGVTYNLYLYDENGSLVKTETGLTGNSYTWTTEETDSGLSGRLNNQVRIRLNAERSGVTSFQEHDHTVIRPGYVLLIDSTNALNIDGNNHFLTLN